jgi:hypothetical protein
MNVIVIVTIVRRNKHEDECGAASRRAITDPSFPAQPIPYYYSSTVCNPLAQFSTSSTISASASPQSTHPTMNVLSHSRCAVLRIGIRTHLDDLLQPLWSILVARTAFVPFSSTMISHILPESMSRTSVRPPASSNSSR